MSNKQQLQSYNTALGNLITRVNAAMDAVASLPEVGGGGSGGEVATCTIEIINESLDGTSPSYLSSLWFVAYENGEYVGYGGSIHNDYYNKFPEGLDLFSEKMILNNVVCGSMMAIQDDAGMLDGPYFLINGPVDSAYLLIPPTPNVTHTFKIQNMGWGEQ